MASQDDKIQSIISTIKTNPGATICVADDTWFIIDENGKELLDSYDLADNHDDDGWLVLQALAKMVGTSVEKA